jgi:hypothetical protein
MNKPLLRDFLEAVAKSLTGDIWLDRKKSDAIKSSVIDALTKNVIGYLEALHGLPCGSLTGRVKVSISPMWKSVDFIFAVISIHIDGVKLDGIDLSLSWHPYGIRIRFECSEHAEDTHLAVLNRSSECPKEMTDIEFDRFLTRNRHYAKDPAAKRAANDAWEAAHQEQYQE